MTVSLKIEPTATRLLFCDLTQSWSETGGGIGTYIRAKRRHILDRTDHGHLLIVPGEKDEVRTHGRSIHCTVRSPLVPKRTNYRLLLRNRAVRELLSRFRPALIECQDAYNLPWAALRHAKAHPGTAVVGGYCTDFPTVYLRDTLGSWFGEGRLADAGQRLGYAYCAKLYRRFDAVYAMSEHGGAHRLRALGIDPVHRMQRGVDLDAFTGARRNDVMRRQLGIADDVPLLVSVGRLDREKGADMVGEAFRALPDALGAHLLMFGDGPLRGALSASHPRLHAPGYVGDRDRLARWLASADIYVSGMAHETFGISIIEAQACGLPVVGVAAGAMIDRVPAGAGTLVPPRDPGAMRDAILDVWRGDREAMRAQALALGERYDWSHAMSRLFDDIYPAALRRAAGTPPAMPVARALAAR